MLRCMFTTTGTEQIVSYAPVIESSCTTAMASALPVGEVPISFVKVKTRRAAGCIHYQELVGYLTTSVLEPVFFVVFVRTGLCRPYGMSECWMATHRENLQKSGNFMLVEEKSGTLGKVREIVICLWCASAVVIVTKHNPSTVK